MVTFNTETVTAQILSALFPAFLFSSFFNPRKSADNRLFPKALRPHNSRMPRLVRPSSFDFSIFFERICRELRISIRRGNTHPSQKEMARKDTYTVEEWSNLAKAARYDPESLAQLLDVSSRQLRRYTRKLFNNSPREWLDEQRLTDAAFLLQGNKLIKSIAFNLGFKTVSHFSNKFKTRFGISPKSYKEQFERFKKYCSPLSEVVGLMD